MNEFIFVGLLVLVGAVALSVILSAYERLTAEPVLEIRAQWRDGERVVHLQKKIGGGWHARFWMPGKKDLAGASFELSPPDTALPEMRIDMASMALRIQATAAQPETDALVALGGVEVRDGWMTVPLHALWCDATENVGEGEYKGPLAQTVYVIV